MSKFVISPHFRLQEWVAEEKGYFRAEGLDVTIDQGEGSAATVTRIMSGAYDAGFGDMNAIIQNAATRPADAPVMVYMIWNQPPFAIVTKKTSGINTIKDVLSGDFTNDGTIEVVTGVAGSGTAPDTDPVNTLVLDHDDLTNTYTDLSSVTTKGTVLATADSADATLAQLRAEGTQFRDLWEAESTKRSQQELVLSV